MSGDGALLQAIMDKLEDMERKLDALGLGFFGSKRMDELIAMSSPTQDHLRMLAEAEQPTMAHARPHPVAPAPDAIVFGPDMRELDLAKIEERNAREMMPLETGVDFPLLSTCTCGRQITVIAIGHAWEYCGA